MGILVWDELDANGRPIEIDPKEVKSYRKLANKVLSSLQGYLCKMAADAKNSFFVYFPQRISIWYMSRGKCMLIRRERF